ncbi:MAG: tyrosine-type recombinase/integrase [Bryobacterales bacterium]
MHLVRLFETFTRERQFLHNVTPKTLRWYECSWTAFGKHLPADLDAGELTNAHLKTATIALASNGLSAISVNTYTCCINAFLRWLADDGHTPKRLRIARLKEPALRPVTLKAQHVRSVLKWQPKAREYKRLQVLMLLLLDCGLRISEALTLERSGVDFEQSTVSVMGKGRKARTVPISNAMRKRLWVWLKSHEHATVFPNREGGPLTERYVHHAMQRARDSIGIAKGQRFFPHGLRHTFAVSYLRAGGDVFRLQRILGHSTLEMTRRYVHLQTADLTAVHDRFSPLTQR